MKERKRDQPEDSGLLLIKKLKEKYYGPNIDVVFALTEIAEAKAEPSNQNDFDEEGRKIWAGGPSWASRINEDGWLPIGQFDLAKITSKNFPQFYTWLPGRIFSKFC
jgi:hypothetical protein